MRALVLVLAAGCSGGAVLAAGCSGGAASPAGKPAAGRPDAGAPAVGTLYPALRCGECHNSMFSEWQGSAHSRAGRTPLYAAMRTGPACDACHAPLAAMVDPAEPLAHEGVTCAVCHSISDVVIGDSKAQFTMNLRDNIEYGPRCDAKDHYFHKMGCSPRHRDATVCAACHHAPPEYPEYQQWRDGPYADEGVPCQGCHMPGEEIPVAEGSPARGGVPNHGFLGAAGDLRARALTVRASASVLQREVTISVVLTNSGAGHNVPTGMPGRQIVVVAAIGDRREEYVFEHAVEDAGGHAVPFPAATRDGGDNSIPPKESREVRLVFHDRAARGTAHLEVRWRSIDPRVAASLGVAPEEQVLATQEVAYGR